MTESVYFPGGGWTTAALATPHLLAAAATAAAASSALGGDGGAGLCGVSSSTIFPDAYPDVALVFFRPSSIRRQLDLGGGLPRV